MTAPANQDQTQFLNDHIAYRRVEGTGPTVLWLGGFKSDMTGSKAQALSDTAQSEDWNFLRFDYSAHGESKGLWDAARIGTWRQDVLAVVDALTDGPLILVGSSMGGWMASLLIKDRPQRVKAAVLIAPAPDFATELMLPNLSPEDRHALSTAGAFNLTGYEDDVLMSQAFFDEAANHRVLTGPLVFDGPVRILHGTADDVVPWAHGVRLMETLTGNDVRLSLIKSGDHRLSRPEDLTLLVDTVRALRAQLSCS
ncbi:MAG: alpha/beta hydrolase [Asticcacaulis sp.]